MANNKPSICFDCQNGYAHKCKWVAFKIPIKGWKAEKREYSGSTGTGYTYSVIKCPHFKRDLNAVKKATNDMIIELAQNSNLSLRAIGEKCGVSEHKVYTVIKGLNRKVICASCGKQFVKETNSKRCPSCR